MRYHVRKFTTNNFKSTLLACLCACAESSGFSNIQKEVRL